MGAANAGEHGRNMPIACVERLAALAVMPADAGEPPLQRSATLKAGSPAAADSLHAGGEIEADGLRVRGQGIEALPAQPGGKLPPIGVIGAPGVVRAGVAGVIAGLFGERGEMGGGGRSVSGASPPSQFVVDVGHRVLFWRPFGARRRFGRQKSDASAGWRRSISVVFARNSGRFESCPISPHYRTCETRRQARRMWRKFKR